MHPDQKTPAGHRDHAPDSQAKQPIPDPPEQSQQADIETTGVTVRTPDTDGARVAEAGHGYVGRMMDDDLKANPRVEDGDAAVDEDPTTPGDE